MESICKKYLLLVCLLFTFLASVVLLIAGIYYLHKAYDIERYNNDCSKTLNSELVNNTIIQTYSCVHTPIIYTIISIRCKYNCNETLSQLSTVKYCIIDSNTECSLVSFKSYGYASKLWIIDIITGIVIMIYIYH